jgi:hypothetical protein
MRERLPTSAEIRSQDKCLLTVGIVKPRWCECGGEWCGWCGWCECGDSCYPAASRRRRLVCLIQTGVIEEEIEEEPRGEVDDEGNPVSRVLDTENS